DRREIVWKGETISGWSYLSSGPAVPCVEPTCWVYLANKTCHPYETNEIELDVYSFLNITKISSQDGISWGFVPWSEPRILPTCIAIRVLCKIQDKSIVNNAVRWLIAARDSQNVWGPAAKSTATLTHTAHAILALKEAGYESHNPVLSDGYSFLANGLRNWLIAKRPHTWSEDNTGFMEIIDIPSHPPLENRPTRIQYYFNPLLLSAIALCSNSEKFLPFAEAVAIDALQKWPKTRWKHPSLQDHPHVTSWSIFDHLLALEPFYLKWFGNHNCSIAYFISSDGAILARLGITGKIFLILRSRYLRFFVRLFIITGIFLFLANYILGGLEFKNVLITVLLGVISSIVYNSSKGKIFG
ncbi:MAG TPA: hypothetical protein VMW42_04375, partial [Desulfatiglandales bacterium]|nr:hypothetical protein [Desulfatiglandales bacterium]